MTALAEIASKLEEPFALEDIDFLPKGQFEKDGKSMVMGLPYADPRVYQDRLNVVCPGEWTSQASVTVAGNKIIALVTVTICGVPHTDIGEASLDGPTKENAGTESFAQGFKRACSQVGLGRYLYSLDKAYLPYDKQRKRVVLDANGLRSEVRKLYAKAGLIAQRVAEQSTTTAPKSQAAPASESKPEATIAVASEDQWATIRALCEKTGQIVPAVALNVNQANNVIRRLEKKVDESKPAETPFRPAGATEQAFTRMVEKCEKIAGEGKGQGAYQRIRKHVAGDLPDDQITDQHLTDMWTMINAGGKKPMAKAS
jgi:hypothetical protein